MADRIVAIIGVGDDVQTHLIDEFGGVKWIEMPKETFDRIIHFLEHPEEGVRVVRPKRKSDG